MVSSTISLSFRGSHSRSKLIVALPIIKLGVCYRSASFLSQLPKEVLILPDHASSQQTSTQKY
ncbi:hypothetical protein L484_007647 [Morus notabilis]|uniref:Uncharacterized protein n=1 Tax=Morus notabilis TaxID=981085 RepID=W9R6Q9_9ROSA|nr:hypothetical protein L484_007647 [Morus notabilis]